MRKNIEMKASRDVCDATGRSRTGENDLPRNEKVSFLALRLLLEFLHNLGWLELLLFVVCVEMDYPKNGYLWHALVVGV